MKPLRQDQDIDKNMTDHYHPHKTMQCVSRHIYNQSPPARDDCNGIFQLLKLWWISEASLILMSVSYLERLCVLGYLFTQLQSALSYYSKQREVCFIYSKIMMTALSCWLVLEEDVPFVSATLRTFPYNQFVRKAKSICTGFQSLRYLFQKDLRFGDSAGGVWYKRSPDMSVLCQTWTYYSPGFYEKGLKIWETYSKVKTTLAMADRKHYYFLQLNVIMYIWF